MTPLHLKAVPWAAHWRSAQTRNDGVTPYLVHPLDVVRRLARWGVGPSRPTLLQAALFHDLIEDTACTRQHIAERNCLVDEQAGRKAGFSQTGLANGTPEALLIKVADRLCNVADFEAEGRSDKAVADLSQGAPVLEALLEREDEIRIRFSAGVCHAATAAVRSAESRRAGNA